MSAKEFAERIVSQIKTRPINLNSIRKIIANDLDCEFQRRDAERDALGAEIDQLKARILELGGTFGDW